jgi:hypothetical protein
MPDAQKCMLLQGVHDKCPAFLVLLLGCIVLVSPQSPFLLYSDRASTGESLLWPSSHVHGAMVCDDILDDSGEAIIISIMMMMLMMLIDG